MADGMADGSRAFESPDYYSFETRVEGLRSPDDFPLDEGENMVLEEGKLDEKDADHSDQVRAGCAPEEEPTGVESDPAPHQNAVGERSESGASEGKNSVAEEKEESFLSSRSGEVPVVQETDTCTDKCVEILINSAIEQAFLHKEKGGPTEELEKNACAPEECEENGDSAAAQEECRENPGAEDEEDEVAKKDAIAKEDEQCLESPPAVAQKEYRQELELDSGAEGRGSIPRGEEPCLVSTEEEGVCLRPVSPEPTAVPEPEEAKGGSDGTSFGSVILPKVEEEMKVSSGCEKAQEAQEKAEQGVSPESTADPQRECCSHGECSHSLVHTSETEGTGGTWPRRESDLSPVEFPQAPSLEEIVKLYREEEIADRIAKAVTHNTTLIIFAEVEHILQLALDTLDDVPPKTCRGQKVALCAGTGNLIR